MNNNITEVKTTSDLISGRWENDLGSIVSLECNDPNDCTVTGSYQSKVGNAVGWNKLSGRYNIMDNGEIQIGFSCTWTHVQQGKHPSISSFVGVLRPHETPTFGPAMYLSWQLVRQTEENTLWDNTLTKSNKFFKSGYTAPVFQDTFDSGKFQKTLTTDALGRSFVGRRLTDTTMNIVKREITEGGAHGTLVLAEEQSKPQARYTTRTWSSKPSGNLYFSLLIRGPLEILQKTLPASAVAVVRACAKEGVSASVKWPNDVWVSDKKLSGMIARSENLVDAIPGTEYAINLGVGININEDMNQNNSLKDIAISVSQATGKPVQRENFLANYLNELEELLKLGSNQVMTEYTKHSRFQPGDTIKVFPQGVEHPENTKSARVVKFNEWFQLVVDGYPEASSTQTALSDEEVSIRL